MPLITQKLNRDEIPNHEEIDINFDTHSEARHLIMMSANFSDALVDYFKASDIPLSPPELKSPQTKEVFAEVEIYIAKTVEKAALLNAIREFLDSKHFLWHEPLLECEEMTSYRFVLPFISGEPPKKS